MPLWRVVSAITASFSSRSCTCRRYLVSLTISIWPFRPDSSNSMVFTPENTLPSSDAPRLAKIASRLACAFSIFSVVAASVSAVSSRRLRASSSCCSVASRRACASAASASLSVRRCSREATSSSLFRSCSFVCAVSVSDSARRADCSGSASLRRRSGFHSPWRARPRFPSAPSAPRRGRIRFRPVSTGGGQRGGVFVNRGVGAGQLVGFFLQRLIERGNVGVQRLQLFVGGGQLGLQVGELRAGWLRRAASAC